MPDISRSFPTSLTTDSSKHCIMNYMNLSFTIDGDKELLIKVGQKINFNEPISNAATKEEKRIPLSSILKITPSAIIKCLKKFVGEEVKKGEVIAQNNGLLGSKTYVSDIDGVIKEVNHAEGVLVIETIGTGKEIVYSFFKGEITNIDGRIITLKIDKYAYHPLQTTTHSFGGEIVVVKNTDLPTITSDIVNDKILIVEKVPPYDQVKLETLGAKGFVTIESASDTSLPVAVVKNSADWKKLTSQDLPYCIISKEHNTIYFYA